MSANFTAFTFPGQGSQYIGMGKELAEGRAVAAQVFEEIDDALGQSLSKLMFSGDEETLKLTENTQPALMAVSMALIKCLEAEGFSLANKVKFVAGHSLGEYSALCAAGVLSVSDTAKLLRLRGQAMQRAVPVGEGAMAAIIGPDIDTVRALVDTIKGLGVVSVANDNANGQVVISGHKAAVEKAAEQAKENGARMAVLLPVSAPFHCTLMQRAADEMAEAIESAHFNKPKIPVFANVTASAVEDVETIKKLLVEQITGVVRWRESVENMAESGVGVLVEIGAGKVLSGLARRINKEIKTVNIENIQSLAAFLETV